MDTFFDCEAAAGVSLDPKSMYRKVEGLYTTLNGLGGRVRDKDIASTFEGFIDAVSGHRVGEGLVKWSNGDVFEGTFVNDRPASGSFVSKQHGLKYIGKISASGLFEDTNATLIYTHTSSFSGGLKAG
eukprot:CAMPEP_0118665422 /NCGR_PEP_ID=MMETSP0785-20121206/18612_1 /TAXON_ID=91992 /ORGANISM="Bolidomonas pacifica, Strain CCMP 1866" /LENGTH=127 /DNA_ID=CAMNT_0006559543 /DNA_START=92 /DNA_END=472 /DNA_ORIENTATION=-